jgi:polyisoprenoid-binding protein YceI
MPHRFAAAVLVLVASIGVVPSCRAQSVSNDISRAPSGSFKLEPAHSQILFAITHFGLTDYYGRFDKVSGTLDFDSAQPEKSAVAVSIDMNSVDTPSARLNDELKTADVFAADKFPIASFKSESVIRTGPDTGRITGELTIRGVTKQVTLDTIFSGSETTPTNHADALGFRATSTIKRSDFGLTGMIWNQLVGDDVKLIIEAMFVHEKE